MGRSRVLHKLGLYPTRTQFDHFKSLRTRSATNQEEKSVQVSRVSSSIRRLSIKVGEEQIWPKSCQIWKDLSEIWPDFDEKSSEI